MEDDDKLETRNIALGTEMEKPESEMTEAELRAKANELVQKSLEVPQDKGREWVNITREVLRLRRLADSRRLS